MRGGGGARGRCCPALEALAGEEGEGRRGTTMLHKVPKTS